jgi:hypothetical protein
LAGHMGPGPGDVAAGRLPDGAGRNADSGCGHRSRIDGRRPQRSTAYLDTAANLDASAGHRDTDGRAGDAARRAAADSHPLTHPNQYAGNA